MPLDFSADCLPFGLDFSASTGRVISGHSEGTLAEQKARIRREPNEIQAISYKLKGIRRRRERRLGERQAAAVSGSARMAVAGLSGQVGEWQRGKGQASARLRHVRSSGNNKTGNNWPLINHNPALVDCVDCGLWTVWTVDCGGRKMACVQVSRSVSSQREGGAPQTVFGGGRFQIGKLEFV